MVLSLGSGHVDGDCRWGHPVWLPGTVGELATCGVEAGLGGTWEKAFVVRCLSLGSDLAGWKEPEPEIWARVGLAEGRGLRRRAWVPHAGPPVRGKEAGRRSPILILSGQVPTNRAVTLLLQRLCLLLFAASHEGQRVLSHESAGTRESLSAHKPPASLLSLCREAQLPSLSSRPRSVLPHGTPAANLPFAPRPV